jgi:hypothetical protein
MMMFACVRVASPPGAVGGPETYFPGIGPVVLWRLRGRGLGPQANRCRVTAGTLDAAGDDEI